MSNPKTYFWVNCVLKASRVLFGAVCHCENGLFLSGYLIFNETLAQLKTSAVKKLTYYDS